MARGCPKNLKATLAHGQPRNNGARKSRREQEAMAVVTLPTRRSSHDYTDSSCGIITIHQFAGKRAESDGPLSIVHFSVFFLQSLCGDQTWLLCGDQNGALSEFVVTKTVPYFRAPQVFLRFEDLHFRAPLFGHHMSFFRAPHLGGANIIASALR